VSVLSESDDDAVAIAIQYVVILTRHSALYSTAHETDQGEVQLNLVVQGYSAQLIAQFQKTVINRSGSSNRSRTHNEANEVRRS
jgi:hypothetical protein